MHQRALFLFLLTPMLTQCSDAPPDTPSEIRDTSDEVANGFDDHTSPQLVDEAAFFAYAAQGDGLATVKFVLLDFAGAAPQLRFYDSAFYLFHDEWYWFRLLNGHTILGLDVAPVAHLVFSTIQEIILWAQTQSTLPLDLTFVSDGRLYSPNFYQLALRRPRSLGAGTLIYAPGHDSRPPYWFFELEYSDAVKHSELVVFFDVLRSNLPESIGADLRWIVRSPVQEGLAQEMEAQSMRYHTQILRYGDLVIPGEVQVYNEGLKAGRMRKVAAGDAGLGSTRATDVLLMADVPDWLPPATALLTAIPQTPLAHLNILARNRGIPNAYLGGLFEHPDYDQLARVQAPVIVRALSPDTLNVVAMTEAEYRDYLAFGTKRPIALAAVDPAALPYTYALETLDPTAHDALRPIIGGKASGFLALMATGGVSYPEAPLVITVRAYMEHLAQLDTELSAMLADADFRTSPAIQRLLLDGLDAYDAHHRTEADRAAKIAFYEKHPAHTPIGRILAASGFQKLLLQQAIAPSTLDHLREQLTARFGHYAPTQGLRFRSSASIEDIEGFNGAGLYRSNTGYLEVQALPAADRHRTIARAIARTWASYWSYTAFTERRLEGVDHRRGNMAILVHARFDDALELANGVSTFSVLPAYAADAAQMTLNLQHGSEDVANPTPGSGHLPEIVHLTQPRSGPLRIARHSYSTLSPGAALLSDAELAALFSQAYAVTTYWLERSNAALPPEQRALSLTLDLETRKVAANWPADGSPRPERVLLKQARTLEPGLRAIPETLLGFPFPRDILSRAQQVQRWVCTSPHFTFSTVEATTQTHSAPQLGFERWPFAAYFTLDFHTEMPALGIGQGHRLSLSHLAFTQDRDAMQAGAAWSLGLALAPSVTEAARLNTLSLQVDAIESGQGVYTISAASGQSSGAVHCEAQLLYASPEAFLTALLLARGLTP